LKIAFSTRPFSDRALTEAIRTIASLGYDGVEILADFPHAYPDHVTPAVLDLVRGVAEETGIRIVGVSAITMGARGDSLGPSWVDRDPATRQERFRYTVDCIRMAGAIDTDVVLVPAGGPWHPAIGVPEAHAFDWLEQGIRRLIPFAEEFGVSILLEPGPGLLVPDTRRLRHLVRRIDHPSIAASLEIGHAFSGGESPERSIAELGPRLRYVHLEDVPATREHMHLVPGRGAVDLEAVARALREEMYTGVVAIDVSTFDEGPEAAAAESLDVLRTHLF
jgi:sugar phosphate isomerase/epimerase